MLNNCTICGKPIVLMPTAIARAKQDNGRHTAAYYTAIFTEHSVCTLDKRKKESLEPMAKRNKEFDRTHHNHNCLVPNVACG